MAKKTLRSLILVESAAKARTIRKFVGRTYAVISTEGFLKDLPKSRIGVGESYQPDYITVRGQGKLLSELKRETLNARRIFLATNPDARGEFLARQCCELFGVNPKSHCRIVLEELTRENFTAQLESARAIDGNLADAFQAKQILDKYVSHKVGEYLERKIWRGVKVGRFRGMLLKLIAEVIAEPPEKFLSVGRTLTPAVLQELARAELNFSPARTRFIVEQLYEGINFGSDCAGLVTYPHGEKISLTSKHRELETVREFLTDYQFKLYSLIHAYLTAETSTDATQIAKSALSLSAVTNLPMPTRSSASTGCNVTLPAQIKLDGTVNDLALMAKFDALNIPWSEFYSVGIASLLKRKYIAATDSAYEITELGQRVLDAVEEFFDDVFSPEVYNSVAEKVREVAAGKAQKFNVIENYCAMFNAAFDEAMNSLGEDAQPQEEPVVESDEVCEKCGRKMLIRHGRYGAFLACSGYPECKNAKPILERLEQKCPKCGEHLAKRSIGRGRTYYCCEACDFKTWDEPQSTPCKVCGSTMFVHRFKDHAAMIYCGNENCSTRENHPMNKILEDSRSRAEARKKHKNQSETTEAKA